MGGMEFNKIFAAILVAGIVASFSGFLAKELIHPRELDEAAYPIEGIEGPVSGASAAPDMPEPVLAMIAGIDPAEGEKLSRACAACHTFDKGGPDGTGPNLWNVMNRGIATKSGYPYSDVFMSHKGEDWSYLMMNKYMWKPKKIMPGTKMNYIGLKKPEDRAAIIAWMRTLADNPKPLPSDAQIAAEEAELAPPEPEGEDETDEAAAEEIEDNLNN